MAKLKALLGDIPADEREAALQYHSEDYFDDAGADNEAEVDPGSWRVPSVAAMIKNDLKHTGNDGEFTVRMDKSGSGYRRKRCRKEKRLFLPEWTDRESILMRHRKAGMISW